MDKDKLEFLVQKQCQLSFIHSNISNPNSFDVSFQDGKSEAPLTKRAARKKAAAERPLKCFQVCK